MKVQRDNVEFLRAWEDGTWDVESYDCPEDSEAPDFEAKAMAWCLKALAPKSSYRKVVSWSVYAIHPNGMMQED